MAPATARCFLLSLLVLAAGCGDDGDPRAAAPVPTPRPGRCADFTPDRNLYFGDLHVHTAYSFDAHVFDVRTTPYDAYRLARGEALLLPPLDSDGRPTQRVQLRRRLDFAAVTDHSEFLGEVEVCTVPGAVGFDSEQCKQFRAGGNVGLALMGIQTAFPSPERSQEVCGDASEDCLARANEAWRRTIEAAEAAYDRSEQCAFTSFAAYEYTANTDASARHRNVIFRGERVPFPTTYIEQPTPQGLWAELRAICNDAGDGCDALAIPHNSNESNGHMFFVEYPGTVGVEDERRQAELRASMEPLAEIYQHKGDSECNNGLSGILGEPDELCDFEKRRPPPFDDCGDGTGQGGSGGAGCLSRLDFLRGALLAGLQESRRIGVNPYRLGFVASTDTHNGTPGAVEEDRFAGHRGSEDATPERRLGGGTRRSGPTFSPGGLAAIWAEENSRESLFDALRRREVYGTSGPRIAVRVFGGWDFTNGMCDDPGLVAQGYERGVPMGGVLAAPPFEGAAPTFVVSALSDPGTEDFPGTPLQRLQVIKGWIEDGRPHQAVYDVAGDADNGADVDPATCERHGDGLESLCAMWRDPGFDASQHAFYYARVIENPSCRWTAYQCNSLSAADRPGSCDDPDVPKTVQERAWTSPIWYEPTVS